MRGSGTAECVSAALGPSRFHKHLALRNPPPARRGRKHSGLRFGVSSRAGWGGSCDLLPPAPFATTERGGWLPGSLLSVTG